MWVFARHFIKEDSKVLSWYDTGSARHSQKLPKKLPNTALFDRFGQTHRQTHKKPLRPILNGLSGISNWSGRQDCFAISLRSSNPRCGLRRIAAARLLSNPAAHRQKNPSRKREGFNFGRGDRIASPSSCFPGGTPFLKTLRQTCLLAGSHLWRPATKKPFSQARRV